MSYTPTNWSSGDIVTAEKLNKLEQGVAESSSGGSTLIEDLIIGKDKSGKQTVITLTTPETFGAIWEKVASGIDVKFREYDSISNCYINRFIESITNNEQIKSITIYGGIFLNAESYDEPATGDYLY